MKILKYRIFLSILGSIFIILYYNSENKGLCRWWTCFRMAVVIASILAGLIPNSADAIESYVPNNSPSTSIVWTLESIRAGFSINFADRILKPHEIDKTIFKNDKKLVKGHDALVKSNKSLKKDFKRLEKNIAEGNFKGGRDKGMQRWKGSKNIYYMGKKTTGARIYFKFVPGEYKV